MGLVRMYVLHMYIPYVNIRTISVSVCNNRANCDNRTNGNIESNLKTIYNTEFFIFVLL